jgi:hypothetical protein
VLHVEGFPFMYVSNERAGAVINKRGVVEQCGSIVMG